jgi:hypothetical protein
MVRFGEIVEDWTGWCPKKQRVNKATGTDSLQEETSMKMRSKTRSRTAGMAAIILALALATALVGMWLEFEGMQSLDWFMGDPEAAEGYLWLANNTEEDATVLAWWDYADGIEEIAGRGVVINEASWRIRNTISGYIDPRKPWHTIEYALWYPFESDERVRDVADFFVSGSEDVTAAREIARKYGADYALVMSGDLGKYHAVVTAAEGDYGDYMVIPKGPGSHDSDERPYPKKETIFTRMVNGDYLEGFTKEFDNGRMRIYKLV